MNWQKLITVMVSVALVVLMICNIGMYISVKDMTKMEDKVVEAGVNEQETKKDIISEKESEKESEEVKETVKENMVSKEYIRSYFGKDGDGVLAMLRDTFPECVIYYDEKYEFVDIDTSLAPNELKEENFDTDKEERIVYKEENKVVSKTGIDVSIYQGDIDWKAVKADGIEYAMIRVGYRGYGTGKLVKDEKAEENIKAANKAGIKVGVYFFSQAITEEEAVEEAEYVMNIIKKYDIEYPVAFDTEEIAGDTARTDTLTPEKRTDIAIAFCERIKEGGYTPMIYANIKWLISELELDRLEVYEKWFAYYSDELYYPYEISMWQYSNKGKIDGINGDVDVNIEFKR